MPTEEEPKFQCPRCQRVTGQQDRFAVHERDKIKVIVRCADCRHRWSVIMQTAGARGTDPGPA